MKMELAGDFYYLTAGDHRRSNLCKPPGCLEEALKACLGFLTFSILVT